MVFLVGLIERMYYSMKRISLILAAVLAVIICAGCSDSKKTESSSSSMAESAESQTDAETETAAVTTDRNMLAENSGYTVKLVELGENVLYPQVSGMSDEAVQKKINDYLKSLEDEHFKVMQEYEQSYTATAVINYSDDSVLSLTQVALFNDGNPDKPGSSETNVNFNMKTGEELKLSDFTDISELAEKIYSNQGVKVVDGYDNAKIEDFISGHDIKSAEGVKEYLEKAMFIIDMDKNVLLNLSASKGSMDVLVEI